MEQREAGNLPPLTFCGREASPKVVCKRENRAEDAKSWKERGQSGI